MSSIPSLGLIGAGNMAEALLRGALNAGLLFPEHVTACDPMPDRQRLFREQLKVRIAEGAAAVAEVADHAVVMVCDDGKAILEDT